MAAAGHPHAGVTSRVGKAAGVDVARRAVADLAPLLGAYGFQQASPVAKTQTDITGPLHADGIHDSLYRSDGVSFVRKSAGSFHQPQTRHRRAEFDTAA